MSILSGIALESCSDGAHEELTFALESGPRRVVRRSCAAARSMVTEQGRALPEARMNCAHGELTLRWRPEVLARIICVLAARGRPTGAPVPAADDGRHQFSLTRAHGSSPVNRVRRSHRSLRSASPGARTAPQSAAHGNDRRPRRHAAPPHVDSPPGRTVPTAPGTSASGHGLRHPVPRRPGNARRRGPVAALTHTYSRRPSTPPSPSFRRRRPGSVRRC